MRPPMVRRSSGAPSRGQCRPGPRADVRSPVCEPPRRPSTRSAVRTESAADGARVMDELLARKKLPQGDESGTFGANGRWQAQVQTVREPLSLDLAKTWELKEVALELYRLDGRRERLIDLKTYRLGKKTNP